MSDIEDMSKWVDDIFQPQSSGHSVEAASARPTHHLPENLADRLEVLAMLGGAAVFQAAVAATHAIRNMRK